MTGVHERIPLDGFVDTFGTSIGEHIPLLHAVKLDNN